MFPLMAHSSDRCPAEVCTGSSFGDGLITKRPPIAVIKAAAPLNRPGTLDQKDPLLASAIILESKLSVKVEYC